jgi:hypothetical protein
VALFHSLRHRRLPLPLFLIHGLEEAAWIANRNIRESLGIALTGVLRDNEITPAYAVEVARRLFAATPNPLQVLSLAPCPSASSPAHPSPASRLLWMTGYSCAEQGE